MRHSGVPKALAAAAGFVAVGFASSALAVNLLVNPGFEAPSPDAGINTNATGWTFVNDTARANFFNRTPGGVYSIWLKTFQDVQGSGIFQNVDNISVGATYTVTGQLLVEPNFNQTGSNVKIGLQFLDGTTPVGSPTFTVIPASNPPAPSVWNAFSASAVAPAGSNRVQVFLGWDFGTPGLPQCSAFWDDIVLDGPGIPPGDNWILDGSGNWNVGGNWGNGNVPNAVGATAGFLGAITAPRTVFTDTAITVGQLNFNNTNRYVITGAGSLTFDVAAGQGTIDVATGSHKLNLPIHLNDNVQANVSAGATLLIADPLILNGRTLNKTGTGTMLIEAPVRSSGAGLLRVSGGETRVDYPIGDAATPTSPASTGVGISVDGSKVTLLTNQTLRLLDAVTTNPGDQEIDLGASRVRVYAANLANEELSIYNDIRAARLSGSGRDGIYSSNDDPGTNLTVGVTDQSLDARGDPSVLVRLTRTGDANVDGITNIGDFALLGASFNLAGRWDNGDFNYDGTVNISDFALLGANFNLSAGDLGRGAIGSAVPEPAMLSAAIALSLLARRRR